MLECRKLSKMKKFSGKCVKESKDNFRIYRRKLFWRMIPDCRWKSCRRTGIYSSRYAGEKATDEENNTKLLTKLKNISQEKRTAFFVCVLVLYQRDGSYDYFEGNGTDKLLTSGAGITALVTILFFLVPELKMTAAELPAEIKNKVSHRGRPLPSSKRNSGKD